MNSTELLTQLNWRYATKQFDPNKKLSDADLDVLLQSLQLSPSSFGLQGRGFVVVEDANIRKELLPYARNQTQIVDASHLILLCRRTDVNTDFITHYIDSVAQTRGIDVSHLDGFKNMLLGFLEGKSEDDLNNWLAKQTYIAQGFLLSTCAMMNIDACPMEGFDSKKFDEILGLTEYNLASCVVVPIGYRSADDKYAHMAKVRFPQQELIIRK